MKIKDLIGKSLKELKSIEVPKFLYCTDVYYEKKFLVVSKDNKVLIENKFISKEGVLAYAYFNKDCIVSDIREFNTMIMIEVG